MLRIQRDRERGHSKDDRQLWSDACWSSLRPGGWAGPPLRQNRNFKAKVVALAVTPTSGKLLGETHPWPLSLEGTPHLKVYNSEVHERSPGPRQSRHSQLASKMKFGPSEEATPSREYMKRKTCR